MNTQSYVIKGTSGTVTVDFNTLNYKFSSNIGKFYLTLECASMSDSAGAGATGKLYIIESNIIGFNNNSNTGKNNIMDIITIEPNGYTGTSLTTRKFCVNCPTDTYTFNVKNISDAIVTTVTFYLEFIIEQKFS